jgi:SAP domain
VRDQDDHLMAALEPGKARMRHPDPEVDDAIVDAAQVPHLEHGGWQYVEGDRETWPDELRERGREGMVYIRNRYTGGTAFVPELAGHLAERGWEEVDPEAEQAAALEGKTVEELRDLARDRGLKVSGTKDELLARLRETGQATVAVEVEQEQDTEQAGDQPAEPREGEE